MFEPFFLDDCSTLLNRCFLKGSVVVHEWTCPDPISVNAMRVVWHTFLWRRWAVWHMQMLFKKRFSRLSQAIELEDGRIQADAAIKLIVSCSYMHSWSYSCWYLGLFWQHNLRIQRPQLTKKGVYIIMVGLLSTIIDISILIQVASPTTMLPRSHYYCNNVIRWLIWYVYVSTHLCSSYSLQSELLNWHVDKLPTHTLGHSIDIQLHDDVEGATFLGLHQGTMICMTILLDELNPNLRGIVMTILVNRRVL